MAKKTVDIVPQSESKLVVLLSDDWINTEIFIKKHFEGQYTLKRSNSNIAHKSAWFTKSFLQQSNTKTCYISSNFGELMHHLDDIQSMAKGTYQNNNILFYPITYVDKREKLYKRTQEYILETKYTVQDIINVYFAGTPVIPKLQTELLQACEGSLSRCYFELSKAISLSNSKPNLDVNDALSKIIQTIPSNSELDSIKLVNAIIAKDLKSVKSMLGKIDFEKYDFGLATLLYNNFRNMYVVKSATGAVTQESTGLTPFQIRCVKEHLDNFSLPQLKYLVNCIYSIDKGIKSGTVSAEYAMDLLLVNCLES